MLLHYFVTTYPQLSSSYSSSASSLALWLREGDMPNFVPFQDCQHVDFYSSACENVPHSTKTPSKGTLVAYSKSVR